MYKKPLFFLALLPYIMVFPAYSQKGKAVSDSLNTGKTWAVVVGISAYENIESLNYADRDAQAFYDYLVNITGGPALKPSNIKLLLNENASSNEIYGALNWLQESAKKNDRIIFYFSGHGDVETKNTEKEGFLLAYNAPKAAYAATGTVSVNYLQKFFKRYIDSNKVKNIILIADACRSGKLTGGTEGLKRTIQALEHGDDSRIIKILSSQENELSLEGTTWGGGRGVFSYYLVKGIEGLANNNNDNSITTAELAAYLTRTVADQTGTQHPEIIGDPKLELFKFDQELLEQARHDLNTAPKTNQGAGDGIADEPSPKIQADYKRYLYFTKQGRLLWGKNEKDTINCARYIYKRLIINRNAAGLRASLKSSFITALQRKSQDDLDNYVKNDRINYSVYEALKEISYLRTLVSPTYVLYNYMMARFFFLQVKYTPDANKAVKLIKKALTYEDDAPYALNDLGGIFGDLNMPDSGAYYARKAILAAPKWYSPYHILGNTYDAKMQYDTAIYYYQKAVELDSTVAISYYALGNGYQGLNLYDKALRCHLKAIALDSASEKEHIQRPYLGYYYFSLGIDYDKLGDPKNAVTSYKKSLQHDSTVADTYTNLGGVFQELKDYDKALANFRKAILLDSNNANAYDNMGIIWAYKNDFKRGIPLLQKAIALNPDDITPYYNMACAYAIGGDKDKSLEYLQKLLVKGYTDYGQIMQDEDLNNLKKEPEFNKLMQKYFPGKIK